MILPKFITFTGADDRTDKNRMNELSRQYPIEWGILLSTSNKDARYPSNQFFNELGSIEGKKSLHLCGGAARHFNDTGELSENLLNDVLSFDRIQINGAGASSKAVRVAQMLRIKLITQVRNFTFSKPEDALQLFDTSGGTGKFPESLPEPSYSSNLVGYSGGISIETIEKYLIMIEKSNTNKTDFWLDMESGVRTNGWFDLDKVEKICQKVFNHKFKAAEFVSNGYKISKRTDSVPADIARRMAKISSGKQFAPGDLSKFPEAQESIDILKSLNYEALVDRYDQVLNSNVYSEDEEEARELELNLINAEFTRLNSGPEKKKWWK